MLSLALRGASDRSGGGRSSSPGLVDTRIISSCINTLMSKELTGLRRDRSFLCGWEAGILSFMEGFNRRRDLLLPFDAPSL